MSTSTANVEAPLGTSAFAPTSAPSARAVFVSLLPYGQAIAAVAVFTLVVHAVHFGFAAHFGDPLGYVVAILRPLALTLPAFLLLKVVIQRGRFTDVLGHLGQSAHLAALSIAGFAPVIWYYLITSPTPTYPIIAALFGALAFWLPFGLDVLRRATPDTRLYTALWVALMWLGAAGGVLAHLARELAAAPSAAILGGAG